MPTQILKTFNPSGSGADNFTTNAAVMSYIRSLDLAGTAQNVLLIAYANLSWDQDTGPASASDGCILTIASAPGMGVNDSNRGAFNTGSGISVVLPRAQYGLHMKGGVDFLDLNIVAGDTGRSESIMLEGTTSRSTFDYRFQNCRFIDQTVPGGTTFSIGGKSSRTEFVNCLFVTEHANDYFMADYSTATRMRNCTFVARGAALRSAKALTATYYGSIVADTVFIGFNDEILTNIATVNCYSNTQPVTGITSGFTVNTAVGALVVNETNDFTPSANGGLIAKSSLNTQYTTDILGGNRGDKPDVGARQRTAFKPTPTAKITKTTVDAVGNVVVEGTTTNGPTTAIAKLLKTSRPFNDGIEQTNVTVQLGTNTFSITYLKPHVGEYLPELTFTNDGGSAIATDATTVLIPGAVATITSSILDGQIKRIRGTVTGNPVSGIYVIPAAAVSPDGATDIGPAPVTLNGADFSVDVPILQPGAYDPEIVRFTTANGTGFPATGGQAIYINGFDGNPEAPPNDGAVPIPAPVVTGVTVTPATLTDSGKLSAVVSGLNNPPQDVTWTPEKGTVDVDGNFVKPAATNVTQTFKVTATSKIDPTKSGFATITIAALPVVVDPPPVLVPSVTGVVVTPADAVIADGAVQAYQATVNGPNNPSQAVTWTTDLGTVDLQGRVAAPATSAVQTGHVTATSVLDPTKKATVTFTVAAKVVVIDPPPVDPPPVVSDTAKTTLVEFLFLTPEGKIIPNGDFEVRMKGADYNNTTTGVIMPRPIAATTDAQGKRVLALMPCDTMYYATMYDAASDAGLSYKFYVPEMEAGTIVRLQDIVVEGELPHLPYDQDALLIILKAKADAQAAAAQAKAAITALAGPDGATKIGYGNTTVAAALDAGTGGGGGGTSPATSVEVVLQPNAAGELLPTKAQGLNFRVTLTANQKLLNPQGYSAGDHIRIVIRQDAVGSRLMAYDTQYALPNAQVPALSTAPKAADKLDIDVTMGVTDLEYLVTPSFNKYSVVTELAMIGSTAYFRMSTVDNQGAFNKVLPGQTIRVIRHGVGPEVTGTILGVDYGTGNPEYMIVGVPVEGERPLLKMLADTRPSFNKAVINFEKSLTATVRDLRITGARNNASDARGIAVNQSGNAVPNVQHISVENVEITDCNNGILTGNDSMTGSLTIRNTLIDKCGVGGPDVDNSHGTGKSDGYVHNVYMGHSSAPLLIEKSAMTNSITGHNIKSRCDVTELRQVLTKAAMNGRELNLPNGGVLHATNCHFWKVDGSAQNNMIGIGEEGITLGRTREYIFRNVRFQNDMTGEGRDVTHIINMDPTVKMRFIDCEFIGDLASRVTGTPGDFPGMVTKAGIRYYPGCEPIFELTGGPIGPILPVGYFPVTMTPVVG